MLRAADMSLAQVAQNIVYNSKFGASNLLTNVAEIQHQFLPGKHCLFSNFFLGPLFGF